MVRPPCHLLLGSALVAASVPACAKADRGSQLAAEAQSEPTHTSTAAEQAPKRVSPAALAELLAAVPSASAPAGSSRIGSDTGVKPDASASRDQAEASALPAPANRVRIKPPLSSNALERAAREQLYWPLARACRLPNGELPPAESVTLHFDLRADGSVFPSTVGADVADPQLRDVAACVERVFAASGFRGPIEGRGASTGVRITWPSVD